MFPFIKSGFFVNTVLEVTDFILLLCSYRQAPPGAPLKAPQPFPFSVVIAPACFAPAFRSLNFIRCKNPEKASAYVPAGVPHFGQNFTCGGSTFAHLLQTFSTAFGGAPPVTGVPHFGQNF